MLSSLRLAYHRLAAFAQPPDPTWPTGKPGWPAPRSLLSSSSASNQQQQRRRPTASSGEEQARQQRMRRTGILLGSLVIGVLGLSYAAVPLYRLFCQATGYAGTTQRGGESAETLLKRAEQVPEEKKRLLTIYFVSSVSTHLPWSFVPLQHKVQVMPGEGALAFFNATNNSDKPLIGVATYNVAPSKAGVYFHKIQCFCFDEQMLEPGESVDMPVFFYVDPELLQDPKLDNTDHITLSYTFFNSQGDDDAAMALSLIPENERRVQTDDDDDQQQAVE